MSADQLKAQGNAAFQQGNFDAAVDLFSKAIEVDPANHVLYSNRSGAYASLKQYDKALQDAEKTVQLKPDWPKSHSRLGAALFGLNRLREADRAYAKTLELDPNNTQAKQAREDVQAALDGVAGAGLGSMFGPDLIPKLAANPKTRAYLAQPDFMKMLGELQRNPSKMTEYMQDPRILQSLGVALGVNMQTGDEFMQGMNNNSGPSGAGSSLFDRAAPAAGSGGGGGHMHADGTFHDHDHDAAEEVGARIEEVEEEEAHGHGHGHKAAPAAAASKPAPTSAAADPEPEPDSMEVDPSAPKRDRAASDAAKELGNAAYKKKDFETALKEYERAVELDGSNVAVLNNKAAVLFELKRYDEVIKVCEEAIERGREERVDFKVFARAYERIGNAYRALDDLPNAIKFYQKSLTEHRSPDVLNRLKDCEKLKLQRDKEAYHDPALATEARERGNDLFKKGKWPEAVKEYTEAVKRDETDPRNYSNRAACYLKLMAIAEAERDVEQALKLDPGFVKGYVRKAQCQFARKDFLKALEILDEAKAKDVDGKHAVEIQQQYQKTSLALYETQSAAQGASKEEVMKRAAQDPEVQRILNDPVMMHVLRQMESDPAAVKE
ncbi:hypothetical protein HDU93_007489 [Gonapodya sp. JEL0774]|nr:hypothetical protein HDU93_007489 [Gonapodya sp. JEL0774]